MEMKMATPNDYGMMWMNPSQIVLPQGQGAGQALSSEILQMDPSSVQLDNPYYPMAVPHSFESMPEQPMEIEGFLMMHDYEQSYCDETPKYMTAATQTSTTPSRKVKAIKHPGLKLQTPIAYKCGTDPSVIPIEKDGMAHGIAIMNTLSSSKPSTSILDTFWSGPVVRDSMAVSEWVAQAYCSFGYIWPGIPGQSDVNLKRSPYMKGSSVISHPPTVMDVREMKMTICEKCGAIGVKHSFYTRHRKYCSLACARGSLGLTDVKCDSGLDDENSQNSQVSQTSQNSQNSKDHKSDFKFLNGCSIDDSQLITKEAVPLYLGPPSIDTIPSFPLPEGNLQFPNLELPDEDLVPPIQSRKVRQELANSYNWDTEFGRPDFTAVPVSCFKNVPMSDCWDNITVGMKVEVENRDCEDYSEAFPDSFWVATVLRVEGYKALLRYEGFGHNSNKDFWVNLCINKVHSVGWCATRGKPLIPPKTIEDKYKDWKEFLVKRLTGARTLPSNFYSKVQDSLKSRFRVGLNVEVVDKNRISQVCVATVKRIVGKRLHVEYYNAEPDDNGFWCHEDSPLIHPVGWASRVGHLIDAPEDYVERCECGVVEKDDATDELFTAQFQTSVSTSRSPCLGKFQEGMKLEAVDPLNLASICVATVMKVLKDDYLMIRIDSYPPDAAKADWFCYHSSSPCIFPPGFSQKNSITLIPPKDYGDFNWETYVKETGAVLAPESLFEKEIPSHGFAVGMQLEAVDLMDPRLVCVATVSKVVGRLLRIHFDGWEDEYDQWLDCESPDIYPVGWCAVVSHKLEGPRSAPKPNTPALSKKRHRKRMRGKTKVTPPGKKGSVSTSTESESRDQSEPNSVQDLISNPESQGDGSSFSVAVTSGELESNIALTKEPEMGGEPSGPDQSLPVSADPSVNTLSSGSTSVSCKAKYIPRLIDATSVSANEIEDGDLNPSEWAVEDVDQFLKINDCSAYSENFIKQGTDGKTLLSLTKDQIMDVIGFKIGPTLKIFHLIQQLKLKSKKNNLKKSYLR